MKITPFFPLFFLFGISVFAIRNLMDWLKWWGYPFLIAGAISALIAFLGAPAFGLIVQNLLEKQGSGSIPPILFSSMRETASVVTSEILKPVALEGLILAILGLGMIIVALYLTEK
jgi:hypothetical protein